METSSLTSKQSGINSFLSDCTMNSETSLGLANNDDQPGKSGVRTGYKTQDGHISQIPGLSPTISPPHEEKLRGRRAAVLDGDSDYVKLAKQGGHKELLWHEERNVFKTNAYKPADWFCTQSGDPTIPSSQKNNSGAYLPLDAPFGTDNMSTWERDRGNGNGKDKNPDANYNQMEEVQTSSQYEGGKYKRTVFDKKPAPVDMTKLLSFGYADDSKPKQ
ncbi:uncharacterized protein C7orf57 homolog isoform X1 [Fundulus heteroclitus]|uniref:uncharacterized protein C7orf57 homolog isoform X1 n=1 Tax=Fundulus heteroclitus TaxID=8078 RepID=UPI00165B5249|nr:uncharacterized protein C7orf57 homolog isoform X1 [Fundulus heteroclitus]